MTNGVQVGIIGMGKAGPAIGSALRAAGAQIVAVSARSEEARDRADAMLPGVPVKSPEEVARAAEILILAVPDSQIRPLTEQLVSSGDIRPGMVVIHLAGALGLDVLDAAHKIGAITMALHPAMTFSGTSLDVKRLEGSPVAYSTSPLAQPVAVGLIEYMGGRGFPLSDESRPLYHAGLVHGANHMVTLVHQSQEILAMAGIDEPTEVLQPLAEAALERALVEGLDGLTGPASRGDKDTILSHLAALAAVPELENAAASYRAMAAATMGAIASAQLKDDRATAETRPRVAHTRDELAKLLEEDRRPTALVMTMGALHQGHFSLVEQARRDGHKVVVTIFVNPAQFGPEEDLQTYPRKLDEDVSALAAMGVDIVYAPPVEEVYPAKPRVTIQPGPASTVLEGDLRPGHFAGVLQVVGKMMNRIRPQVAIFGQKDAQQFVNIQQMVEDLDMEVELVQAPIVRDDNGLALSSRNAYLDPDQEAAALSLRRALAAGEDAAAQGEAPEQIVEIVAAVLEKSSGIEPQYVALADPQTFEVAALRSWTGTNLGVENLTAITDGRAPYLLVAAQVGPARLIDNVILEVQASD